MKKSLAILFAVILFASWMQVSIDHHYCGGQLADTRISLTGKMASCGMEQSGPDCPLNTFFDQKCCEDKICYYSINTNYYSEYLNLTQTAPGRDLIPADKDILLSSIPFNPFLIDWVLPPGDYLSSAVTQSGICIFRI